MKAFVEGINSMKCSLLALSHVVAWGESDYRMTTLLVNIAKLRTLRLSNDSVDPAIDDDDVANEDSEGKADSEEKADPSAARTSVAIETKAGALAVRIATIVSGDGEDGRGYNLHMASMGSTVPGQAACTADKQVRQMCVLKDVSSC